MTTIWLLVAMIGTILALMGLWALFQRYRRGETSLGRLVACLVGFGSLASYAALSAFAPASMSGVVTMVVLAPALVAVVFLVRRYEREGRIR